MMKRSGAEALGIAGANPQLLVVTEDYLSALERLRLLDQEVDGERWGLRSQPQRWSVSECVAHLNVTSRFFIPELERAVREARSLGVAPVRRYRRDPVGWLLYKIMPPPVRFRAKAPSRLVPEANVAKDESIREFEQLQEVQVGLLHQVEGLAIDRVKVPSPFNSRISYNLFAAFSILPLHQHRHLWQAEQVWLHS